MRKWSCSLLNKAELRKQCRRKQAAISQAERQMAAITAAEILARSTIFDASIYIACYFARDTEFDTTPVMQLIWQAQKKCCLPLVSTDEDKKLEFVVHQENDPLQLNRYRILEPLPVEFPLPLEMLDLVFVPLLAFDTFGYRLGSGGGYYDRTFSFLSEKKTRKPLLIGLGFQQQALDVLPHDVWDIRLDGILTEQGLQLFS